MTVDYDGVIVGGTVQGREAAAIAAREGARVALVEAPGAVDRLIHRRLMVEVLAQAGQRTRAGWFSPAQQEAPDWAALMAQVDRLATVAYPHLALEELAARGVDVVPGAGHFSPQRRLTVATAERSLRARGVLLCPGTQATVPAIPGLSETPYGTVDTLAKGTTQPQDLVILGRSPEAIALAQSLARLGTRVTLVSRSERLLPREDWDISIWVESMLMAAGVTLHLGIRPERVDYRHGFTLQLADGAVIQATDGLVATARQPDVAGLNLKAIGIRPQANFLPVDDRLNTTHPRVFACGPALGGYWAEATDSQDVAVALRNALYLSLRQLTTLNRPGWLATVPAFARIGMTAVQAQRGYGAAAIRLQVPLGEVLATHLAGDITGFCRWVVHREGRLLGAQICGPQAPELIQTVALIMQQNLGIQQIQRLPYLPHSHGEILHRMVETWQQQRWHPGTWRRDWAENWFNWRRSRPHR